MAVRKNQAEHETMVRSLAIHLKEQGHSDIKVDLFGGPIPDGIYWETRKIGYIPDVTSTKGQHYLFEVETDDSIDDAHTADEWSLFAANAKRESKLFIVVVPKGSEQVAWQRAQTLGITLDGVWPVESRMYKP
jgi:hypothetical protein